MASQNNCCAPTEIYSERAVRRDAKLLSGWDVVALRWGWHFCAHPRVPGGGGTKFRDPLLQLCLRSLETPTILGGAGLPRLERGAWRVYATQRVLLAWLLNVLVLDPFNTPMMEYLYVNGMIFILFERGGGKNQYLLSVKGGFMFG